MSEHNVISPLLEGYVLGNAMSKHDGVVCYPALKEETGDKYIVKVISVPASQIQLEALLLTGACKDPAAAMDYFKTVADEIILEADFLKKLSKMEGFLPYEECQIVPMEGGQLGYHIYLRGSYKRSLQKYISRHSMTDLSAINLALDLCAALAISRRYGQLYIDLKPGNIFLSKGKEYRIGDLGFVPMDALKYTSLPSKYRSPYSPPELQDGLKTINETADTYAVGMILYQIYNNGQLPKAPRVGDPFPFPANANYELSEIILKAVAPDPANRWEDPMAMGKALVAYMQKNPVNDTPILPPMAILPEEDKPDISVKNTGADETLPSEEDAKDAPVSKELEPVLHQAEEILQATASEAVAQETAEEASADTEAGTRDEDNVISADDPPAEQESDVAPTEEPAHEEKANPEEEDEDDLDLNSFLYDTMDPEADDGEEDEEEDYFQDAPQRKPNRWIAPVITVLILACMAFAGFWFYTNYYLQEIEDLRITGTQNQLTVHVDTDAEDPLITVVCTDTYGNAVRKTLTEGKAAFPDLLPGSLYKINLEISGLHKLTGKTSEVYTTESQTSIVSFTAVNGPEDGSVLLTFTVNGVEPNEWIVIYGAEGEEEQNQVFTGHNVTVKGLTVNKTYTLRLSAGADLELLGQTTLDFTASELVQAEDLTISSSSDGQLTVHWNTPADTVVESWVVRCYNDGGQEQIQEVTGNEASFSDIDHTKGYTVEVTAAGMTQPVRTSITAHPINVKSFQVDESDPAQLTATWEYDGNAPEGGWLLMYSFEGSEGKQNVVKCDEPKAVISTRVPSAGYHFVIQAADGTSIFDNERSIKTQAAKILEMQGLSAENVSANLLETPEDKWSYETVGQKAFANSFSVGTKLSMVLHSKKNFYIPEEEISILYVFRDENGRVLPELITKETGDWCDLWYAGDYHYGELDIPVAPDKAGQYSLNVYINNCAVTVIDFTLTDN